MSDFNNDPNNGFNNGSNNNDSFNNVPNNVPTSFPPSQNTTVYSTPTGDTGNYAIPPVAPVQPTVVPNNKGFDIASLVLGILAIIPGCCCTYLGIILGIVAIVFSYLYTKSNKDLPVNKTMATAGLILGIVAVVLCTVLMIVGFVLGSSNFYQEILNNIPQ